MSRSNWRARKANVGSGRDEHHHGRDTPPSPLLRDDAVSPLLLGSTEASPRAYIPHEQRMISHLYGGAPSPLLAFHSELESVRRSTADESLDSGKVFAESMIVTDIMSAFEQQQGSALSQLRRPIY